MPRRLTPGISLALLGALASSSAGWTQAPEPELRDEIEALKKGQEEIRKELAEIKRLLRSRAPAQPAAPDVRGKVFDLGSNPVQGEPSAKLTLVEFTDYQ